MQKKLDPDYEPPTDEQIAEAIETAKKTFMEHDHRLREKLSQIVTDFDSADNKSWIRLACRLTTKWGGEPIEWVDAPLPDLLSYVHEAVHEREKQFKTVFKSKPLVDLFFTVRTINCFDRAGLKTIGDLIQKSPEDLLLLPHFGKKSLAEVREQLDRYELKLRGD